MDNSSLKSSLASKPACGFLGCSTAGGARPRCHAPGLEMAGARPPAASNHPELMETTPSPNCAPLTRLSGGRPSIGLAARRTEDSCVFPTVLLSVVTVYFKHHLHFSLCYQSSLTSSATLPIMSDLTNVPTYPQTPGSLSQLPESSPIHLPQRPRCFFKPLKSLFGSSLSFTFCLCY